MFPSSDESYFEIELLEKILIYSKEYLAVNHGWFRSQTFKHCNTTKNLDLIEGSRRGISRENCTDGEIHYKDSVEMDICIQVSQSS